MDNQSQAIITQAVELPVSASLGGEEQNGISFGSLHGRVLISIVKDGEGLSVWLGGEDIDLVAGLMAVAVQDATRADAPSLRSAH